VATRFVLRVHERAIDIHVEDASVARDERGLDAEFLLDRIRQTGGDRVVVSGLAVLDGNAHDIPPSARSVRLEPNERDPRDIPRVVYRIAR
jgi:hypothetical protein